MSAKFLLNGSTIAVPDPNEARWEFMEPMEAAISGRRIQQGNMRITVEWELMTDDEFGTLMQFWVATATNGFRIASAVVPPWQGSDNATWATAQGPAGDDIAMLMPTARRIILHAEGVRVVFEDVVVPAG